MAEPHDELGARAAVRFCRDHDLSFAGICFDDPLLNINGIKVILYARSVTPDEQLQRALHQAYNERDVVSHEVLICPDDWFQ